MTYVGHDRVQTYIWGAPLVPLPAGRRFLPLIMNLLEILESPMTVLCPVFPDRTL